MAYEEIASDNLNTCPALLDVRAAYTGADTYLDGTNLYWSVRNHMVEADESAQEKNLSLK